MVEPTERTRIGVATPADAERIVSGIAERGVDHLKIRTTTDREALGVMQAREAVPDLVALLSHESPELRYWAAYSLGQIGDPASIPELERVAAGDTGILFRHGSVKQEAQEALAAIRQHRTT